MTVMLELPSEMETRLREQAARNGEDVAGYLLSLTEEALQARQAEWDDTITAIREGLADVEAGRTIALEDFVAQEQASVRNAGREERCLSFRASQLKEHSMAKDDQEPPSWAIRLSERAHSDISAAWHYHADTAGEEFADAWQEGLEREFAKLAQMPERNPTAAESEQFSEVTRQFLYRRTKSSVAYRVLFILKRLPDESPQVFIIHVRHGSQKPITQEEAWAIESSE